jgi:hypothetical protein
MWLAESVEANCIAIRSVEDAAGGTVKKPAAAGQLFCRVI